MTVYQHPLTQTLSRSLSLPERSSRIPAAIVEAEAYKRSDGHIGRIITLDVDGGPCSASPSQWADLLPLIADQIAWCNAQHQPQLTSPDRIESAWDIAHEGGRSDDPYVTLPCSKCSMTADACNSFDGPCCSSCEAAGEQRTHRQP